MSNVISIFLSHFKSALAQYRLTFSMATSFFPIFFFFSSLASQTAAASQLRGLTSAGAAVVGHLTATFGTKGPSQFEDTLKRS